MENSPRSKKLHKGKVRVLQRAIEVVGCEIQDIAGEGGGSEGQENHKKLHCATSNGK